MASTVTQSQAPFFAGLGTELRDMRIQCEMSQELVGELMGWSRFAISKIENGNTNLSLLDYLRLIDVLREANPDHPAILLINRYGGRKAITGA